MSEGMNIQFERVPKKQDADGSVKPELECNACSNIIRRDDHYLHFGHVKRCFDCWPRTRAALRELMADNPYIISPEGVERETERVKKRYEEIKGAGTWKEDE